MPTDRYTKTVLTIIAAALVMLVAQNATEQAIAQQPGLMCPMMSPCYITNTQASPLYVRNLSQGPATEQYRGLPPNSGQPK